MCSFKNFKEIGKYGENLQKSLATLIVVMSCMINMKQTKIANFYYKIKVI